MFEVGQRRLTDVCVRRFPNALHTAAARMALHGPPYL